ncbi:HAD family hydrolase [Actinomadura sp. WAC 06369]|uniref:HAD family hydrolase n=1 Tax=Actinomadura sp. WAC 06369 TaxID=2203193 RepID=UPI000F76B030|nr:HAD family phosphatase [Actinomadura sp. WAC 06369]RSN55559.1 haloacid dehalogenase [Actinomadura sp. WAC 06369]
MAVEIPLRAAVFDLDGTLIDSEPRNRVMWRKLFASHGVPHDEALIASFAGRRGLEVLTDLLHLFPGRTAEELFEEAVSYESLPGMPPPAPVAGAVELVRSLAGAGLPLAVVTSGQRGYAEGLLDFLGIRDLLDIVLTAGDVATGKPHPEGYLAAARDLGVPPGEAIGFEDAPAGVAAVKAAGMTCVGITTTQPAAALAAADHVVADLERVNVAPGPALRVPAAGART